MSANGESREKSRRRNALEALERARSLILDGKPSRAMRLLDHWGRTPPREIIRWIDEFLFPATRLAVVYERWALARAWIREAEKKLNKSGRSRPAEFKGLKSEIDLLKLFVQWFELDSRGLQQKVERAFSSLRNWKPWMVDFRLCLLLRENRLEEFQRHLRAPPGCAIRRGTLEYAKRLLYLGKMFTVLGRADRAITVLEACLRMLEEVPGVESLGQQGIALCYLSRGRAQIGDLKKALELLDKGEAIGRRLKRPRFDVLRSQTYSFLYWRSGDYEKGLQANLEFCFSARWRDPYYAAHAAVSVLKAARFALLLDRGDQARRLVQRATSFRNISSEPAVKACLHLLRGDLQRESGTVSGFRAAAKHYDLAEVGFRTIGWGMQTWLSLVSISRGALYLREGKIEEAIRQAEVTMAEGKNSGALDLEEAGVLLKSFLLLERDAPRYDLYETVLRNLGSVREPAYLFKVLANLYLYSWDLEDHLDLTDLHLKQIEKLREKLSPEIYDRLYRTFVTERVLARFRRRFGCQEEQKRKIASL